MPHNCALSANNAGDKKRRKNGPGESPRYLAHAILMRLIFINAPPACIKIYITSSRGDRGCQPVVPYFAGLVALNGMRVPGVEYR